MLYDGIGLSHKNRPSDTNFPSGNIDFVTSICCYQLNTNFIIGSNSFTFVLKHKMCTFRQMKTLLCRRKEINRPHPTNLITFKHSDKWNLNSLHSEHRKRKDEWRNDNFFISENLCRLHSAVALRRAISLPSYNTVNQNQNTL